MAALRVLIVDDNEPTRFVLREYLESSGHTVVGEADGQAPALKAYQELKPDVVTLDLSLTNGDGLSTLKALRQIDAKARVVVVSGNSQKKVVDMVQAAGASFLEKPFGEEALVAAVAKAASAP